MFEKLKLTNYRYKNQNEGKQALMLDNSKIQGQTFRVSVLHDVGNEDKLFMNLLDPLDVKSGRVNVLIQIKGFKNPRSRRVELSYKSLNSSDVFVLDCGNKIYQVSMNSERIYSIVVEWKTFIKI